MLTFVFLKNIKISGTSHSGEILSTTVTQQLKYLAARAPRVILSSSGITHKDKKQRKELRLRVQKSTGGKMRSKLRNYYRKPLLLILIIAALLCKNPKTSASDNAIIKTPWL